MSVATAPVQSLTERFAFAVELVLRGLSLSLPKSQEVLLVAPLALATWNRLKRLVARFAALVEAVAAGRFSTARRTPVADQQPRQLARGSRVQAQTGQVPPPPTYGWLLTLAPELNTRIGRAQIETLLSDPAFLALLAQAPQAGRILRPLCHMLRIELPEYLRLPPRPRPCGSAAAFGCAGAGAADSRSPRAPRPNLFRRRWPKSPPLPGMERAPRARPRRRTGTGPPEN
ncbi:MAG: hypothetical protein JOZ42_17985 [Acetobacteraceae bacterium]|nr:hypothetical protein [Acetobacteraceae bacterium]